MEFDILGELPKSFISDFGLEGGKTLYKDDTRIQLIQDKGSWCKHCHKMYLTFTNDVCDEVYISRTIPRLEFNILPGIIGRLLFSKSELKFNNSEFNMTKLPKCEKIHFSCPNNIISMWWKMGMGFYISCISVLIISDYN